MKTERPEKKITEPHIPWRIYALVGITALLIASVMGYSLFMGNRMTAKYAPLVDAAMEIKLEATMAHLWLEEIISGNRKSPIEDVWQHLDESEWYAQAMLEGGTNPEGTFIPLRDPKLRHEIKDVLIKQKQYRAIAKQRYAAKQGAKVEPDIHKRFDFIFRDFLQQTDRVETRLQKLMTEELHRFRLIQGGLIVTIAVLAVLIGVVLHRFDRRRARDFVAVQIAQQETEIKETNLAITLNSIGDAMIATDSKGCITRMNPVAERLTGWPGEEALGKLLPDIFHIINAKTRKLAENPVERVLSEGKVVGLANHTVLIARDGTERQIADSGAPIFAHDGRIVGVVLVFHDVTDAYQREKEMTHLRKFLANIIDSMPSVLVGVDSEGLVTQWNHEAEKVTGISANKAKGSILAEVFPQLAGQMDRIRQTIQERRTTKGSKIPHQQDGETKFADVTIYPLIANGVEGAIIRIDDVTEHVRIEEMMIQSEKMLSVGGLAAGMAHEINNPLAGILQNIQLLQSRFSPKMKRNQDVARECGTTIEAIHEYMNKRSMSMMFDAINESGKRAVSIVDNMLSFSRKSDISGASQDISELLDRTIELAANDYDLKKKYDFRHIDIIREYDPSTPSVPCASSKIQQVFLNLLKNGAFAMREKRDELSQPPCFTLRVMQENNWVRIEIEDNGTGMNEKDRKRAFEPFFTTKGSEAGTGLGLSVSYFIITENHGGTMTVESSPGNGAKFIIRLPLNRNL